MQNLKPCPCGQIPKSVSIADNGSKWAYVSGDCCGEWSVEFRTQYHRIDTDKCMALAVEAWNAAGRSSLLTPHAADCCPNCSGEKYVERLDGTRVYCEVCGGTVNSR